MNIYENYDGNDINDATFMVDSFVEELQLREKLSPKLKALAAAGLIGLSSLGAASCSMPNDPTAYETPAEEETKTPADDLNPSDNDPDAGDEGGAGSNTDATADWPEPEFIFYSDSSTSLAIYNGTLGYEENFVFCEENLKGLPGPTWEDDYTGNIFILTPEIENGKIIINENKEELTDKYANTSHDIIYFIEKSKGLFSECRYYILYDELFKNCKEAGIEITSDVSKAFEAFNSAYVNFELETHQ